VRDLKAVLIITRDKDGRINVQTETVALGTKVEKAALFRQLANHFEAEAILGETID
jgi:hypothetical protein